MMKSIVYYDIIIELSLIYLQAKQNDWLLLLKRWNIKHKLISKIDIKTLRHMGPDNTS
jgi:hypothetical protein